MNYAIPFSRLCKRKIIWILISAFLLTTISNISGQGNLLITPKRIVFEGNKRSIDMNLANVGNDTSTYSISLVQIRMTEDGAFETINQPDPNQMFADKYIRFFPRSVKLGPNESQVVKVQLYKYNQLASGEYRSHFYFRAEPKITPLTESGEVNKDTSSISVVLKPIFGITIPVIIRAGETFSRASLSDLALNMVNDTVPNFSLTFNRTGNASIYGDLAVYHISVSGKQTKVGIANGIAVYTPNAKRNFRFNLNNIPGVDYSSGTLRAIFSAPSDVKPERYAEAELPLH